MNLLFKKCLGYTFLDIIFNADIINYLMICAFDSLRHPDVSCQLNIVVPFVSSDAHRNL